MTDIKFEEESYPSGQMIVSARPSLAHLIVNLSGGVISDEQTANYLLLGVVSLVFIISFFILSAAISSGKGPSGKTPIPAGPVQPNGFPSGS